MHHCFNIVCGREGEPVAVLVRALEPTEGLETMAGHRASARKGPITAAMAPTALCSGPARLCQALAIGRAQNGLDLVSDPELFVEVARTGDLDEGLVRRSARIGVGYAEDWAARPLRWYLADNPNVSPGRNRAAAGGGSGR